ncbi:MAG TPA: hypothetical protein VM097_09275 [Mycobacteriales bacterium]|nr:hypothetical protein [Mycobacteriales bacterium]
MRRVGALTAGVVLGAVLLTGCGEDGALSADASSQLAAQVARLRTAATSGTSAQVASAAEALRSSVAMHKAEGELSDERATSILDQLARVLADTAARPVPRPTPVRTAAPAPRSDERHGKGKGKGEGEKEGD